MNDHKPWYLSKTIWGSLVAIFAALASALGLEVSDADRTVMTDAALQIATVGGSLLALFGRLAATDRIG